MTTTYARKSSVEMEALQDETILFDPVQNRFCVLNRTATFIWNQLATALTRQALAAKLCGNFSGITMETALLDAERTLELLLSLKLTVDGLVEPRIERADKNNPSTLPMSSRLSDLPAYESPRITAMNEDEVLSVFQVPVVATTWWGM
jgi:hypothetical protein